MLPKGTSIAKQAYWLDCPPWPPDLFAIAATLVNQCGCYTHPRYTSPGFVGYKFTDEYVTAVRRQGAQWRKTGRPPQETRRLWRRLLKDENELIVLPRNVTVQYTPDWWDVAVELMAVADESCRGVGFYGSSRDPAESSQIASLVLVEHERALKRKQRLPYLTHSLCALVPDDVACVQPKTRTPQVGCTLRSLTHHLALLPGRGEFEARWLIGSAERGERQTPLNLLVVPFPFFVEGRCFVDTSPSDATRSGARATSRFFRVDPRWLLDGQKRITAKQLSGFLTDLVQQARRQVGKVHGVVLPEGALSDTLASKVALILSRQTDLELFVSGVVSKRGERNSVFGYLFLNGKILTAWEQSKHHRWRLDRDQICRYHLGDSLDPACVFWEQIEVSKRRCCFYVFRDGASLATIVCEDLARIDPVQTAIRAVGPNLVIALLMDGAQRGHRWSGRYATILADDPGSAVLTVTSLGMSLRGAMPGEPEPRQVAIWKEPGGDTKELSLPSTGHGLLLTIAQRDVTNWTLDGRDDDEGTVQLSLAGVQAIAAARKHGWLTPRRALVRFET